MASRQECSVSECILAAAADCRVCAQPRSEGMYSWTVCLPMWWLPLLMTLHLWFHSSKLQEKLYHSSKLQEKLYHSS